MNFEEYKFQHVYEFAQIIQTAIESETMFWNYDESLAIEAVTHFKKISLLHIYIFSQLLNYYRHYYRKNGDICDTYEYHKWLEIGQTYGINFKTDFSQYSSNELDDNPFFHWYQDNEDVFERLFDFITDEVFFCLYSNHHLLVKFNKIVSLLIKDKKNRTWHISEQFLNDDGTIKRVTIPKWAKDAAFHRDHGKCVFCGKDLTNVYTHTNIVNFDHIIPLKKYGANDPCNIQTTCEQCNKSKKAKEDNPSYKYEPWW